MKYITDGEYFVECEKIEKARGIQAFGSLLCKNVKRAIWVTDVYEGNLPWTTEVNRTKNNNIILGKEDSRLIKKSMFDDLYEQVVKYEESYAQANQISKRIQEIYY